MDKIDEIVDKAIEYTDEILEQAPRHYQVAREGLGRMRENLTIGAEDHPALKRLDDYICELDRRFSH